MRNLKKVLALVLCLVMALSLVTVAGAASYKDFSDADDVSSEYATGVAVLVGLGIVTGDGESLNPEDPFTREMLAFLAYCISLGKDADGAKALAPMYVNYATKNFSDVSADDWAAGAIGYCYQKNIVSGIGDGTFNRGGEVSVAQALLIMLKAAGYTGIGGEFWFNETVEKAMELGLLDTITDNDISKMQETATRQSVMDILFHVMTEVDMVAYNEKDKTYTKLKGDDDAFYNLGAKKYELAPVEGTGSTLWGVPTCSWKAGDNEIAVVDMGSSKEYTTEVQYKKIYSDLKLEDDEVEFEYWVDGDQKDNVTVTKTSGTKVGGDGTTTTVYKSDDAASIVVTNEYLAKVNSVNGNVMNLTVYVSSGNVTNTVYGTEDFDYEKDDMLLVNILANKSLVYTASRKDGTATEAGKQTLWINGEAGYVTGKLASKTDKSYTVGGTKYNIQKTLVHNENSTKGDDVENAYKWYLGSKGYLIGSVVADSTSAADVTCYGVITSIYAELENTDGVKAVLLLSDGTTKTVTLGEIQVAANTNVLTSASPSLTPARPTTPGTTVASSNLGVLTPLYYSGNTAMLTATGGSSNSLTGNLQVSNSVALNAKAAVAPSSGAAADAFGILGNVKKSTETTPPSTYYQGNLFKFVSDDDGIYTAYEVAGDDSNSVAAFAGLNNKAPTTDATLSVEDACLILKNNSTTEKTILLDANTKIMVQAVKTGAVSVYTLDELDGDLAVDADLKEIDWVVNEDGFASVVYFAGKGVTEVTETYGVFYYNKGAFAMNGVDDKKVYTLEGWLDGVKGTYKVKDTIYNSIKDTDAGLNDVQIVDGVISNIASLANGDKLVSKTVGSTFVAGKDGGNSYTDEAKAYIEASKTAGSESRYSASAGTVKLGNTTYRVNEKTLVATGSLSDLASSTKNSAVIAVVEPDTLTVCSIYISSENAAAPTPTPAPAAAASGVYVDVSNADAVAIHATADKKDGLADDLVARLDVIEKALTAYGWTVDEIAANADTATTYEFTAYKGSLKKVFSYKSTTAGDNLFDAVGFTLKHDGVEYPMVFSATKKVQDVLNAYIKGTLGRDDTSSALMAAVFDDEGDCEEVALPSGLGGTDIGEGYTIETGYLRLAVGASASAVNDSDVEKLYNLESSKLVGEENKRYAKADTKISDIKTTEPLAGTGIKVTGSPLTHQYMTYANTTLREINAKDDDATDGVATVAAIGQVKMTVVNRGTETPKGTSYYAVPVGSDTDLVGFNGGAGAIESLGGYVFIDKDYGETGAQAKQLTGTVNYKPNDEAHTNKSDFTVYAGYQKVTVDGGAATYAPVGKYTVAKGTGAGTGAEVSDGTNKSYVKYGDKITIAAGTDVTITKGMVKVTVATKTNDAPNDTWEVKTSEDDTGITNETLATKSTTYVKVTAGTITVKDTESGEPANDVHIVTTGLATNKTGVTGDKATSEGVELTAGTADITVTLQKTPTSASGGA